MTDLSKPGILQRAYNKTADAANTVLGIFSFLNKGPLGWLWRQLGKIWRFYKTRIWDRFARNDEGRVTQKGASLTFVATLFALYMIPSVLLLGWQGVLMATTMKEEVVYLTDSAEIGPDEEIFNVRGNTKPVSTPDNALYYRVRPTLMHTIYSWIVYHQPFYPEDIASVAPGLNKCTVVSYGFRSRILVRSRWKIYPDLLWSECVPYSEPSAQ